MLIADYVLKMATSDCNHSAETVNAFADLANDMSEVFPYLNAVLKRARFSPRVPALAFDLEDRRIVLRPRQIAISRLRDEDEARQVLDWLLEMINRTWERRADIEPSYQAAKEPGLMEVYRLLPGSNCRVCGEATCMAFAAKLVREEAELVDCQPLFTDEHAQICVKLLDALRDCGRSVPDIQALP